MVGSLLPPMSSRICLRLAVGNFMTFCARQMPNAIFPFRAQQLMSGMCAGKTLTLHRNEPWFHDHILFRCGLRRRKHIEAHSFGIFLSHIIRTVRGARQLGLIALFQKLYSFEDRSIAAVWGPQKPSLSRLNGIILRSLVLKF